MPIIRHRVLCLHWCARPKDLTIMCLTNMDALLLGLSPANLVLSLSWIHLHDLHLLHLHLQWYSFIFRGGVSHQFIWVKVIYVVKKVCEITLEEAMSVTGATLYQYQVANSCEHSSSNDLLFFYFCMLKFLQSEKHWNIVMQCSKHRGRSDRVD